jgi:hypothetical protein
MECSNLQGIVACAVIQLMDYDFEDGWLIKSSFITKDEHEASQLTRIKVQQQKNNNNHDHLYIVIKWIRNNCDRVGTRNKLGGGILMFHI